MKDVLIGFFAAIGIITVFAVTAGSNDTSDTNIKVSSSESKISEHSTKDIVDIYKNQVVYIICSWNNSAMSSSGSGFIYYNTEGKANVMTNRHVLINENNRIADVCGVRMLNKSTYYITYGSGNLTVSNDYDVAVIAIDKINSFDKTQIVVNENYCLSGSDIGDKLVVLGFPSSGSGITATEGIISGYEGDSYTTSAPLDTGNSGGIAVDILNNCIVGIPTSVVVGKYEAMGRILSFQAFKHIFN